jgi:hypothetical protein
MISQYIILKSHHAHPKLTALNESYESVQFFLLFDGDASRKDALICTSRRPHLKKNGKNGSTIFTRVRFARQKVRATLAFGAVVAMILARGVDFFRDEKVVPFFFISGINDTNCKSKRERKRDTTRINNANANWSVRTNEY